MVTLNKDCDIFDKLSTRISHLFLGKSQNDLFLVGKVLAEFNNLNYKYCLVENPTKAVLLINQICSNIPTDEDLLISDCCMLMTNLLNFQKIPVEGRTLIIAVQWCLQILTNYEKDSKVILNTLMTLDALLRSNVQNAPGLLLDVVALNGPLLKIAKGCYGYDQKEPTLKFTILRYSLQCLELCTTVPEIRKQVYDDIHPQFEACATKFLKYLTYPKTLTCPLYLKILIICLRGLENICAQSEIILLDHLPLILGVCRSYMLLDVSNIDFLRPNTLLPSTLSIPIPPTSQIREKKGGKMTKQRKHRITKKEETRKTEDWMRSSPYSADTSHDSSSDNISRFPPLAITSDSDFSDSEANNDANIYKLKTRIRQMTLSLLFTAAKNLDTSIMFKYWSYFIPENLLTGRHYLTTCFLEDDSAKCRSAALNVLLYLLTSSKLYLSQAESCTRNTAFTSFSIVLGYMIQQLHFQLNLGLSEKMVPVLAQILKCFAALVQATPYHRLNQGLITKVIKGMRHFIKYKDPTIQVGTLIVLGCVLASEPTVPETKMLFITNKQDDDENDDNTEDDEDFRYAELSSDDERTNLNNEIELKTMPWILERCLTNLGVIVSDKVVEQVPPPVKLESVQIISSMCRNYFDCIVYPFLSQIARGLDDCLSDKNIDLKLHAGRTIDSIGQSMEQYLNGLGTFDDEKVAPGMTFWHTLLHGSLISLLQSEQQVAVKAVGCDCLGSIGSHIFEKLPSDKQILCITLLFACSRDDENSVKSAAIRALGILVLYPVLREDPGFVVDIAEAVSRQLQDENLGVRIKSSWALGNLSDALVLNRSNGDLEELPNSLLLKLLERSIKACSDNDKIKMNVVRTVGNLLTLMTEDLMTDIKFKEIVKSAINSLVKTATTGSNMKVRWNSCYAIGKLFKNESLYKDSSDWLGLVFGALNELVINFRNFKVRINAALALSSPTKREFYGIYYQNTWTSLLKALENSQIVEDYFEYQHRDHLIEQICLSLGHVITVLEADDLVPLSTSLTLHFDIFQSQMKRINDILPPEKSSILVLAIEHLNSLENALLTSKASEVLSILKNSLSDDS